MSDYLDPQNEELLKDFFDEANLQVDLFEHNILALEKNISDTDAVDELFRSAHTLKGAAATVQMQELASFTHIVEDVLDEIREGNVSVTGQIVDVLLQAIDVVKEMLGARAEGRALEKEPVETVTALREVAGLTKEPAPEKPEAVPAPSSSPAPASAPSPAPSRAQASGSVHQTPSAGLTEYDVLEFQDAAGEGEAAYRITVEFDESNPMNTVGGIQVFAALKNLGKVIRTIPDFEELYEDVYRPVVEYYFVSAESVDLIRDGITLPEVTLTVDVSSLDLNQEGSTAAEVETAEPEEETEQLQEVSPVDEETAEPVEAVQDVPAERKKPKGAGGSILRVDSKRIDTLLNLVSEAVINKASFGRLAQILTETEDEILNAELQFHSRLRTLFDSVPALLERNGNGNAPMSARNELMETFGDLFDSFKSVSTKFKESYNLFRSTHQNLGRITGELQEGVMQIRMVPISQIFTRFPRLIRDVSRSLGKKVKLEIEGQDTELDKSVIEDLLDPLIHCVRNAVDHGVETPEERNHVGKDEMGTVYLRASNEGNQIAIVIEDDGKGIDIPSIHKKAVDRGVIHPHKQLSDIEAFNLIFEPGFSTAAEVTDISGRGVGLDVVRKQIEKLNGSVSVWSEYGLGTKITIKLPLTLAIIQGLLIRVGPEIYALPITSVLESQRISPDEIKLIDNYEVMNIRDEVVSLLRMDRLFGIPSGQEKSHLYVVVVGSEENKVGLVVDSMIGEEDVVIKPLQDRFTTTPGIAGATILGDGRVALIIDVGQLLELGLTRSLEERTRRAQRRSQAIV